jgi:hypothetical protein
MPTFCGIGLAFYLPPPAASKKAPKGAKKSIMETKNIAKNNTIQTADRLATPTPTIASNLATQTHSTPENLKPRLPQPLAAIPKAPIITPGTLSANPLSSDFHRLTQYLATRSTMYCKVPYFDTIFVMQTSRKSKRKTNTQTKSTNSLKIIKPKYMSLAIKTFAIVAMLLTFSSSYATPTDDSNGTVKVAFHKDFKKAELMATEVKATYTKLTFKLNDVVMYAYYSDNGELLAVCRNITSNQLPIQLLLEVKKNYSDYWITDLFELTGDGASNYYITLENADNSVTLRSTGSNSWDVYNKKTKE